MEPAEFNQAMLEFFEKMGGEGMKALHELFRAEATSVVYHAFLAAEEDTRFMKGGPALTMSDIEIPEATAHRAKTILARYGLIKQVGTMKSESKGGRGHDLWSLVLDEK